ncbi:heat stress transcription factor B-4-like protein [Tanacetum coccineum]
MEAPQKTVDRHHRTTNRRSQIGLWYLRRVYVNGHVDIFDMVDIDLFTVVELDLMEDVCCPSTLVRSFKLIEVYIEHGVTALDSYIRPPRFRATIEDITDEPGSIAANGTEKNVVIDDVMMKLSFEETKLDGEACFADVARSGVETSGLSHDESFGVEDLELNLNEPVNLNASQIETQYELFVFEESDVGRTQEPIMAEVITYEPIIEEGNDQEDKSAPSDGHFFYDDEGIDIAYKTEYDVQSSEDVHGYGFDGDLGEDDEISNYRRRRLAELSREIEGVINASGQWNVRIRARCDGKVLVFSMSQGTRPNSLNCGMEAGPSESSGPSTMSKKRKNIGTNDDSQACFFVLDAHDKGDLYLWVLYVRKDKHTKNWLKTHRDTHKCFQSREIKHCTYKFLSEKIFDQVRVNSDIPIKAIQYQLQHDLEVQISMSKAFRAKAKSEREIRGDYVLQYSMLRDYVVELQYTNPNTTVKIAVERNIDPSLPTRVFQRIYVCLGALKLGFRACRRDLLGLDGAFMKGSFPGQVLAAVGLDLNNGIYPLAYALVEAESKSSWCWFLQCLGDDIDLHPNSNFTFINDRQKGWCGQAYKDLLWRSASATSVKEFEKCRVKSDLLLNNICEVFNGKIVGGRDKPVITLLEYIMEYCMKRIVSVQSVIDKCTGPLTPTATKIMESIKKEAHFMKVQWNGANKYQVSGSLACWNIALNDWAAPPLEAWVNPCCWKETYSYKVGRPKKKKRSKHEDEPFMKDDKLSKKVRTITCQSCGNNAEASGGASRQAQQTDPAVGQDGLGGTCVGVVIGLSATDGQGGAGVGVLLAELPSASLCRNRRSIDLAACLNLLRAQVLPNAQTHDTDHGFVHLEELGLLANSGKLRDQLIERQHAMITLGK